MMLRSSLPLLGLQGLGGTCAALQRATTLVSQQLGPAFATKAAPPYEAAAQAKPKKAAVSSGSKRIPNAYTLYIQEQSARFKSEGKNTLARAAAEWKSLSEAEKAPYAQRAAQAKAEALEARTAAKADSAPLTGYQAFVREFCTGRAAPGQRATDLMAQAAAAWKQLPDADKARRNEEAKAAREAWKARRG